ncbi:unnamed protein product [Lasius platythorax]|uniref:Uncharacterized protein n=1 Tax=Lasius platythorax TaxID=488582 RepID=A0AAV2N0R4_9HYME
MDNVPNLSSGSTSGTLNTNFCDTDFPAQEMENNNIYYIELDTEEIEDTENIVLENINTNNTINTTPHTQVPPKVRGKVLERKQVNI